MRDRFLAMRWALGLGRDDAALAELVRRYAEPHRHYHTLDHIEACLRLFDEVRRHAARAGEIECALWYHDAVYDPAARDNETASAGLARSVLERGGADPAAIARIERMILATATHVAPEDGDTALLLDLDLHVLGSDAAPFDAYEVAVRAEYAFVPDEAWRAGRRAFLEKMLARDHLFATPVLRAQLEARARHNLSRACARL